LGAGDDLSPQAIGPDGELLHGRRSKRIGGAQDDRLSVVAEHLGEFGNGGRFPAAVHSRHHYDRGTACGEVDRSGRLRQEGFELLLDPTENLLHADDSGVEVGADLVGYFLGRHHTHIGLDERFEQLVEKRLIDQSTFGLEQVADIGLQQLGGFE